MLDSSERARVRRIAEALAIDGDHGNYEGGLLLDLLQTDARHQELIQNNNEMRRQLTQVRALLERADMMLEVGMDESATEQLRRVLETAATMADTFRTGE